MKRHLSGVWRLTRFGEYVFFVIVTTLLGAAAGGGTLGWPLIGVLVANWLAVGYAFMINDVEDAPDDALNPAKLQRNPVSAGMLSPRLGRWLSHGVAVASALLYALLGLGAFAAGLACLVLAYLYSSRPFRLKAVPIADLASHGLLLAGLQFLAAYLVFSGGHFWQVLFPFLLVLAISLYGQLFNELRDYEGDLKAGVTHTASWIGQRATHLLMMVWLLIGILAAVAMFFVVPLIPLWVVAFMFALAGLLFYRHWWKTRRRQSTIEFHRSFQRSIEVAAAIALTVWFAIPSAVTSLSLMLALARAW